MIKECQTKTWKVMKKLRQQSVKFIALLAMMLLGALIAVPQSSINITNAETLRYSGPYWWSVKDNGTFHTRAYNGTVGYYYTFSADATTYYGEWKKSIAGTKRYDVYAYIPNPDEFDPDGTGSYVTTYNATRSAYYHVYHANGDDWVKVDQYTYRGTWVKLGTFDFSNQLRVTLGDRTDEGKAGKKVVAFDCIKFVEVVTTGKLSVSLNPSSAVSDGARYYINGNGPYTSGQIVDGVAQGNHTVSYNTLTNWETPSSELVYVAAGQTTTTTGTYTPKAQVGTITINLTPSDATWNVNGGQHTSGEMVTVETGMYTVTFNPYDDYETPSSISLNVTANSNTTRDISYIQIVHEGSISLLYTTSGVTLLGPQVKVDNGNWTNATTINNLTEGEHILTFSSVVGYETPESKTITVIAGQNQQIVVEYTKLVAKIENLEVKLNATEGITKELSFNVTNIGNTTAYFGGGYQVYTSGLAVKSMPNSINANESGTITLGIDWIQIPVSATEAKVNFITTHGETIMTTIELLRYPIVEFTVPTNICHDDEVELTEYVQPQSGSFSGDNVSGTKFNAVKPGSNDITYTYTGENGLSTIKTVTVQVGTKPDIKLVTPQTVYASQGESVKLVAESESGVLSWQGVEGAEYTFTANEETYLTATAKNMCGENSLTVHVITGIKPIIIITGDDLLRQGSINVVYTATGIATTSQWVITPSVAANIEPIGNNMLNVNYNPEFEGRTYLTCNSENVFGSASDTLIIDVLGITQMVIAGDTIKGEPLYIPGDTIKGELVYIPGDTIKGENMFIPGDTIKGETVYIPGDTIQLPDTYIQGETIVVQDTTYIQVVVESWATTGVNNTIVELGINVFPNPVRVGEPIHIKAESVIKSVTLLTINGAPCLKKWPNTESTQLNAPTVVGTYLLQIEIGNKISSSKIVVH